MDRNYTTASIGTNAQTFLYSIPRAAFTALLLLNFRGLATRLSKLYPAQQDALGRFASSWGYEWGNFLDYLTQGNKREPLFGMPTSINGAKVGSLAAATAAIVAAAPVILAAVDLLKQYGIITPEVVTAAQPYIPPVFYPPSPAPDPNANNSGSFLNSIPKPVIYGGAAVFLYLAAKKLKVI